jgi:hypothetical protein
MILKTLFFTEVCIMGPITGNLGSSVGGVGPNSAGNSGGGSNLNAMASDHPTSMYHATPAANAADYGPADETQEGGDVAW